MKKLLSLVLVLALASLANAMVLSISVGGDINLQEITVAPSTELVLDIHSGGFLQGEGRYLGLVAIGPGTISGGIVTPPAPDATEVLGPEWAELYPGQGMYGYIDTFSTAASYSAPAGTYFDQILFHCDGPGDVLVQLITTTDFVEYAVVDQLVIHQIVPEPATMALLSLGGLLLRRKK